MFHIHLPLLDVLEVVLMSQAEFFTGSVGRSPTVKEAQKTT